MLPAASRWGSRADLHHEDMPIAAPAGAAAPGGSSIPHIPVPATLRGSRRQPPNTAAPGDDPIDVCSSSDGELTPTQHRRGGRPGARGGPGPGVGAGRFGGAARQQQQQQDAGGRDQEGAGFGGSASGGAGGGLPSGRSGFMSARTQLVSDLHKKGQHQQASMFQASCGCKMHT